MEVCGWSSGAHAGWENAVEPLPMGALSPAVQQQFHSPAATWVLFASVYMGHLSLPSTHEFHRGGGSAAMTLLTADMGLWLWPKRP